MESGDLTKRKSSALRSNLDPIVLNYHQEGDIEFGAIFHEKDIVKVAKIIEAHRKPQYSPETRAAKRKAMLEVRRNSDKSQTRNTF